jgi:RNA polymerase sigma-70 factor, ECF subfamily
MTSDRNDRDRAPEERPRRDVPRRMRDREDQELADLAKSSRRDEREAAMAELLQRHHRRLAGVARLLVQSPEDAEDVLQDTYVSVVRDLPRYDPSAGSIEAWTATILRRRAIDHHRKARKHPPALPTEARSDTSGELADVDSGPERLAARQAIEQLLPRLGPRARQALELRYVHDLEYREIAKRMQITEGSVKTTLNRALRRLGSGGDR